MNVKRIHIILKIISISFACIILCSCSGKSVRTGMLVATEAPVRIQFHDYISDENPRYLPGMRIVAFNPGKPEFLIILTEGFYSACYPDISCDGRNMLFAAKQKMDDPWQIWEMDLKHLSLRRITSCKENCIDPVYLPDGRLVFSKSTINDTVGIAYCLYTCNLDGTGLSQITFAPQASYATRVLKDGRLLMIRRQLLPFKGKTSFMVMRPDGTKAEIFYSTDDGNVLLSRPYETNDGRIVFIESEKENLPAGDLISVSYNRPLHSKINLTSEIQYDFKTVLPLGSGKYLVSCRNSNSDSFGLFEFDPEKELPGQPIFSDHEYNVLDVIAVEKYERPKKLPSEVDMEVKTGLLLCQDINFPETDTGSNYTTDRIARKIEVLGVDTSYGIVDVYEDGSFYLKVMADTPFRIRTLDEKNNVVNGPCSWLWLRPNERRGCIGCHEDPELAPENRVSLAVKSPPVMIPVHITSVIEKIVQLE